MMSKKDYILVAGEIRHTRMMVRGQPGGGSDLEQKALDMLSRRLAIAFESQNYRFDSGIFLKECGTPRVS